MHIIDHIAIVVDDLKEAESWYTTALEASVTHREDTYIRLKVANTHIALIDSAHGPNVPHIGILCCEIDDLPEGGTRVEHRDGTTGVYKKDPWGNTVEYIHYAEQCKEKFLDD